MGSRKGAPAGGGASIGLILLVAGFAVTGFYVLIALSVLIAIVFLPAIVLRFGRFVLSCIGPIEKREAGSERPEAEEEVAEMGPASLKRREIFVAILMAIGAVYLVVWTHRLNLEMEHPAGRWKQFALAETRHWEDTIGFYVAHLLAVTMFLALPISRFLFDYKFEHMPEDLEITLDIEPSDTRSS